MIYIKLGFPRLTDSNKSQAIVKLFNCLDGKSSSHQDSYVFLNFFLKKPKITIYINVQRILSLIVNGLKHLDLKPNDNINKEKYGLEKSPKLRKYFLDYLFYFLLLPYSPSKPVVPVAVASTDNSASASLVAPPTAPEIPACMSEIIFKRYKNDFTLDDELEKVKS